MYFDDDEKKAEIRKQTLEITEYIKCMATDLLKIEDKPIDYKTASIF